MISIIVSNATLILGAHVIFRDLNWEIQHEQKIGLIGPNGAGKSSLFRLILEEEHPDTGKITAPKGYKIGHLAQHLRFTESSVLEEACLGLPAATREDEQYKAQIILSGLGFSGDLWSLVGSSAVRAVHRCTRISVIFLEIKLPI